MTKKSLRPIDQAALDTASREHRLEAAVQTVVAEWKAVVPSLEDDVRAIAARIARIDDQLRAAMNAVLRQAGLSDNEFRLLAGLMRIGAPHRAAPTELAGRYVPLTSGGLTGLANRLEQRGLIHRPPHPHDQRSVLIELTPSGRALALETMTARADVERRLMSGLSQPDRARGNDFLRKLLRSIEAAGG